MIIKDVAPTLLSGIRVGKRREYIRVTQTYGFTNHIKMYYCGPLYLFINPGLGSLRLFPEY
jgi:hypothetical protein